VTRRRRLTDFGRGNPRWLGAVTKLKLAAEEAKIQLSRQDGADVLIELQGRRRPALRVRVRADRAPRWSGSPSRTSRAR